MQRHLFTFAILETCIYLSAAWLGVGRNSLRVVRQETDVRNGSRFCALEEKSERKRMKTAVVLVMVILLVSGLANAAPTEASGVIVPDYTVNISQQLGLMKAGNFVIFDIEDGLVQVKEEYFLRPEDNFNENNLEAQKERYEMMLGRLHNGECVYVMYNILYLEQQEGDEAAGKTLFIL
ncbi:uncharacterized protein [Branchiostoma lanceolatum]